MKRFLKYICPLIIFSLFLSCNKKSATDHRQQDVIVAAMHKLDNAKVTSTNTDSLKTAWLKLAQNTIVKNDTGFLVQVNYNLARLYGMMKQDSAKVYIEQALKLVEPMLGNQKYKALVYNGIGNIRSRDVKETEASYYYNKAATIVLSDSSAGLSAEAKSAILLSAAQSNMDFFQYHLAEKMNRAALPLSDSLPTGHINRQRGLLQMILLLKLQRKPTDSLRTYLQQLERLHSEQPHEYNPAFLYDAKIKYFESDKKIDSLLHYQILKTRIDEQLYKEEVSPISISNLINDYSNIAKAYVFFKESDKAMLFIRKAAQLRNQNSDLIFADDEILYLSSVASFYRLQGEDRAANKILEQLVDRQKQSYQTENTKAVTEMNALYQLQIKDMSIGTLNERIKVNQLELQQNRLWLAVLGLGALLLAALLSMFYASFTRRRVIQEKEKILLQQQLLRTQMEPHFIFNTLAAVQSFVRLDKKEEAIDYLNRFSRLLRSSLELSRDNLVPLEDEMEALDNYLCLQQMRFDQAFTYHIDHPEDIELDIILLPPMLIQPYVENAILYGVDLDRRNGTIDISFYLDEHILQVTISDSGNSITHAQKSNHRSLARAISSERMALLGKKACIETIAMANGGTKVTLYIPVVYG